MAQRITDLLAPFASIDSETLNGDAWAVRNNGGPAGHPGPARLEGNGLAQVGEMPYVVSFAARGDDVEAAVRLLHRPVPDPPPAPTEIALARVRRTAAVYPDAMAISYVQQKSGYLPHVGAGWAIRTFLTDAVLLRVAQRALFEDAGTLLHAVDATRHPLAALRLHRAILGHRARFWWPKVAREAWVGYLDEELADVLHVRDMANEVFHETDQLAAEAEQGLTRLLTYFLAAIAAVTVLVQVPLLLDGGGWLEYAALASTIGVLALIMATLFIRLRGGVFRRRPKL
jgi:hypothetical protein